MFSKTVLVFTIFVCVINIGSALICYLCAGSTSSDCAQGIRSSMRTEFCRDPTMWNYLVSSENDPDEVKVQVACLRYTSTVFQPPEVIRDCGYFPANVNPCYFLAQHGGIVNCTSCYNDLCNAKVEDPVVEIIL